MNAHSESTAPSTRCPGCGLEMPRSAPPALTKFNCSPECWSVFTEVLTKEYQNAVLFGRIHQLTVDAYAVQHAGGAHPDKSIAVHLVGLHLVHERALAPIDVPAQLQRLVDRVAQWPHFPPPIERGALTVFDVAMASSVQQHEQRVREWAAGVWRSWAAHHAAIADLANHAFAGSA